MKMFFLLVMLLAPAGAMAGVSCFTITDPDQRALCRATQSRSVGDCGAISDYALRQQCRVRQGASKSTCNGITDQWERQKCRDESAKR